LHTSILKKQIIFSLPQELEFQSNIPWDSFRTRDLCDKLPV